MSERARRLLQGAFDTHIHVGPDVVPRIVDDITLARRFAALGMAGFQLKSHYTSTAERAAVVGAAVPGVKVLGAIALNRAVGGMNPLAVEIAAREGARTVWLPTVDSVNESHEREAPPGAKVPVWVRLQLELREQGVEIEPVAVVDATARCCPRRARCWRGSPGTGWCSPPATWGGTRSSPSSTRRSRRGSPRSSSPTPSSRPRICRLRISWRWPGEARCSSAASPLRTPARSSGSSGSRTSARAGPERSVLSTDLGQTFNPPVEEGMEIMVDRLLEAGIEEEDVRVMAVHNTRRVAGVQDW